MSARQKIILILSFPLIVVASALLSSRTSEVELIPSASSYSAGQSGTKAVFLLLQELKFDPIRYKKAFRDLGSIRGTMVIVDPRGDDVVDKQAKSLQEWVKKGNRLVIFAGDPPAKRSDSKEDTNSLLKPLTKGPAEYWGLRTKKLPDQPRKIIDISLPGFSDKIRINASSVTRWSEPPKQWTILAEDESGPLLLTQKMGQGEIFACSDPDIIANRYISRDQNLRLVLGMLIGQDRSGGIFFDEFHHGYRAEESFWTFVGSSVFAWVFFQILTGALVFFYSRRAENSGRFRSLKARRGRSSVEYVDSMANIFQSCKADSAALEIIIERFTARASRILGIPLKDSNRPQSDANEKIRGVGENVSKSIDHARAAIRSGKSDDIIAAARQLAKEEAVLTGKADGFWKAHSPNPANYSKRG